MTNPNEFESEETTTPVARARYEIRYPGEEKPADTREAPSAEAAAQEWLEAQAFAVDEIPTEIYVSQVGVGALNGKCFKVVPHVRAHLVSE